ncbi:MAG: sugar nucleotide-binding protein [Thermoplasmata archaeon]
MRVGFRSWIRSSPLWADRSRGIWSIPARAATRGIFTADVLVFGADSLVGSHFVSGTKLALAAAGRIDPASQGLAVDRFAQLDLRNLPQLQELVRESAEPVIINFAARTDVDPIERERPGPGQPPEGGPAWEVNARAPEIMARASKSAGKYLIQLSTDFVFDGRAGPYDEAAARSAYSADLSWYGWTKSEAERHVEHEDPRAAIVRISYPYRSGYLRKRDFAHGMMERYRQGTLPPLYGDQHITPTWIPDVSRAIDRLIERTESGIFHVASSEVTTPWEFATELVRAVGGHTPELARGSIASADRAPGVAPRPRVGGLVCRHVSELGLQPTGWREGIKHLVREEAWR